MRILTVDELNLVTGGVVSGSAPAPGRCPPPPHSCLGFKEEKKGPLESIVDGIKGFFSDIIEGALGVIDRTAENLDDDVRTADGTRLDCPHGTMPAHSGFGKDGVPVYTCAKIK